MSSLPGRVLTAAAAVLVLAGSWSGSAQAAPVPAGAAAVVAPPVPPDEVLPATVITGSTVPAPTTAALSAVLAPLLRSPALGARASMAVVDPATGQMLYASYGDRPQPPASTLKLLTAMTALRVLGPDTRLSTRVVLAGAGHLVLVGGGDPTLARRAVGTSASPPGQRFAVASLTDLAARTAAALRAAHTTTVSLGFDDSLFAGPRTAPGWPASYVPSGVVSPVDALSADSGRTSAYSNSRSTDPAMAAAAYFARRLGAAGITVTGALERQSAPAGAKPVASVASPTVADLVELMLTVSDNDVAEALAHLSGARASGTPGTFANGVDAVLATLSVLGVPTAGVVLRDGSGLSRQDLVPASTLALAVAAAVVPGERTLAMWSVFTGVPVAAATGTLADRFHTVAAAGAGVVRAKTGTLTGVTTLAGTVRTTTGQVLAFAVMADQVVSKDAAEAQTDRIAAALVG